MADSTKVLVTGIGGPAAQVFIDAFEPEEYDWHVADCDSFAAAFNLFPIDRRFVVPRGDSPDFAAAVLELCVSLDITVLVPTVDTEFIPVAGIRQAFTDAGIALLMPSTKTLETALDKFVLCEALADVVRVPKTALLEPGFTLADFGESEVCAKPRAGSGSRGIVFASTDAELAALPSDGSYIIQEMLPGAEYSLDVVADTKGVVRGVVPRERIRVDSGIAVVARTVDDADLVAFGADAARGIGMVGVANVQAKLDRAGRPALLEINPRFPGTMSLTIAAGINMPRLALEDLLGRDPFDVEWLEFEQRTIVRTWQDHIVKDGDLGTAANNA